MVVQSLGGLYGFLFYMSEIFETAGKTWTIVITLKKKIKHNM